MNTYEYDYVVTKPELNEDTLMHYGVKGMTWKNRKGNQVGLISKNVKVYDNPIKVTNNMNATDKGAPRSHGKDSGSERENWVKSMLKNKRKTKAEKKGFTYTNPLREVKKTKTRETLFTKKSCH